MRLTFRPEDVTSPAVTIEQRRLREAKPRSYPVAAILAGGVVVAALVYALWSWAISGRVASYGVVATGAEAFHAPIQSVVQEVRVEPGDRVKADQVLYVLTSESARTDLQVAEESLSQERRVLEVAVSQKASLFEDPVQELRDLTVARGHAQELELALSRARDASRESLARRAQELERAKRRADLAGEIRDDRARRARSATDLLAAGAAVPDEVRRADEAAKRAAIDADDAAGDRDRLAAELDAARVADADELAARAQAHDLAQAYAERLETSYAEIEKLRVAEKERGIENIRSRIAGLDARIAHLKKLAGPTEVRALADGVVTEVMVSAGSSVPQDGVVMTVSGTGKTWINAFVAPDRARDVHIGDSVRIYPTTGVAMLTGRVTAGGGVQYHIPPALSDKVPAASAVYARIDLDDVRADLIPGNVVRLVIH